MLLELKSISKIYKNESDNNFEALKNVDLSIEQGEIVAIKGVSGSGKSTLLHILGCLQKTDGGQYFYNKTEITSLNEKQLAKLRSSTFGTVFQTYELLENLTVYENLMIPLLIQKRKKKEISSTINDMLLQFDIINLSKRKVMHLSSGQKQRVAISRALIGGASIIFADEPTAAIDSTMSHDIMMLFKKLNESGITIVIATHDPIVLEGCIKTYNIKDGKIDLLL